MDHPGASAGALAAIAPHRVAECRMRVTQIALWNSLPVPAFLLDGLDIITDINPAAEQFLNTSARKLQGALVFDALAIDAPLQTALARVRGDHSAVFVKNVDVSGPHTAPVLSAPGSPGAPSRLVLSTRLAGCGSPRGSRTGATR